MITLQKTDELRSTLKDCRNDGIALVPTMGNLHAGHLALVEEAKRRAKTVVASIFVNPLQFGANEDLDKYPRTLADDQEALEKLGVDILFAPNVADMYPSDTLKQTRVEVPELGQKYCGVSRPDHFEGVTTVVCKLFNIMQPDVAIFGKKDYQQLFIVRRMVQDLAMPVRIIGVDTMRESDGLAMSSRNRYLNACERENAPLIHQQLQETVKLLAEGNQSIEALRERITQNLNQTLFTTDYAAIVDADTLMPLTPTSARAVILIAAYIGQTRLIDNLEVNHIAGNLLG